MIFWDQIFLNFLNPTLLLSAIRYANLFVANDYLDREFTLQELEIVFAKAKNWKAHGFDEIP